MNNFLVEKILNELKNRHTYFSLFCFLRVIFIPVEAKSLSGDHIFDDFVLL